MYALLLYFWSRKSYYYGGRGDLRFNFKISCFAVTLATFDMLRMCQKFLSCHAKFVHPVKLTSKAVVLKNVIGKLSQLTNINLKFCSTSLPPKNWIPTSPRSWVLTPKNWIWTSRGWCEAVGRGIGLTKLSSQCVPINR